eukprot:TRINITY_DN1054_c0_g2_i1.p3 TRINITY_DN1054_c0_g2~~TRINITY_DN1054_c0_g2_i1.p3  ORF type:complete len:106 (-),score=37.44 TRINITY_DN1054_c0_g2_i1:165-482(-)
MARSSSILAPCALFAAAALFAVWSATPAATSTFLAPQAGIAAAAAAPQALQALEQAPELIGSSVGVATQIEVTMLGLLLGLAPVTALGLFVAAWLQFKKSPTLGV